MKKLIGSTFALSLLLSTACDPDAGTESDAPVADIEAPMALASDIEDEVESSEGAPALYEAEGTDEAFSGSGLTTVFSFKSAGIDDQGNFFPGEAPESVATDFKGNQYVSLALTGEIRKVDKNGADTTLAFLPLGNPADCVGPFPGIIGALAIDPFTRDLYVPVNSCDLSQKGVWRVGQDGSTSLVASLPPDALGNGIALRAGRVYVSDSGSTRIFRAHKDGSGAPAEVWTTEPLLAPSGAVLNGVPLPGANGLQFYDGRMWIANSSTAGMVAIDLNFPLDGTGDIQPGATELVFGAPGSGATYELDASLNPGCDDFAFDIIGRLYCTTDPFQTIVRLNTHTGSAEVVFDATDGLDGPTAVAFGRGKDRRTLYVSNAQFFFFPPTGNGPSLQKTQVSFGGWPLR